MNLNDIARVTQAISNDLAGTDPIIGQIQQISRFLLDDIDASDPDGPERDALIEVSDHLEEVLASLEALDYAAQACADTANHYARVGLDR